MEVLESDLVRLLSLDSPGELKSLFDQAYQVKLQHVGNKVYFRGIIEFSNLCVKDCLYCGIRKSNEQVERYVMPEADILKTARWAFENHYGSVVLQSGERKDPRFVELVERVIVELKAMSDGKLGITLSLGEQDQETYERWYKAGAHRYLLRIETSNPALYARLHPSDHSFEARVGCLKTLREIGYQVGTGVMIGLPFQTIEDLAGDVRFFKEHEIDMIGMGPYIRHEATPLAEEKGIPRDNKRLELALKMIAVTRLYLKDVNIASTTALQALNPIGRELGLQAGANIIMPILTDIKYRKKYQLYDGKPCLDDSASVCKDCLDSRIRSIGEEVGYGQWGDSPHHLKKK